MLVAPPHIGQKKKLLAPPVGDEFATNIARFLQPSDMT